MSNKTHFMIQIDKHGFYKLHLFNGSGEEILHKMIHDMFIIKRLLPLKIPLQEILLGALFININHFRKPSHEGCEWVMIRTEKIQKKKKHIFLLQRTSKKLLMPIPIHDIHKMDPNLLKYNQTYVYICGSYMDYALYHETKDDSVLRNTYNKSVTLFEIMLDNLDLENTNKKRRFY